jgi:hypothetical protein
MPDLPTLDVSGLTELFTIILVSLAVMWGINQAVLFTRRS